MQDEYCSNTVAENLENHLDPSLGAVCVSVWICVRVGAFMCMVMCVGTCVYVFQHACTLVHTYGLHTSTCVWRYVYILWRRYIFIIFKVLDIFWNKRPAL